MYHHRETTKSINILWWTKDTLVTRMEWFLTNLNVLPQSFCSMQNTCIVLHMPFGEEPYWVSEWKDLSNSESQCCPDASFQVSSEFDIILWFKRRCLKNFKMATLVAIWTSSPMGNNRSPWSQHNVWRNHNLRCSKADNSELETVTRN